MGSQAVLLWALGVAATACSVGLGANGVVDRIAQGHDEQDGRGDDGEQRPNLHRN